MQGSPNRPFALIADDDADVRALLSLAVGRASLASVQVEDGRQAIEMLADLSPSVVLLDVKMPGLSGIEVCWWIRRQRHLGDVPVVLVSAPTISAADPCDHCRPSGLEGEGHRSGPSRGPCSRMSAGLLLNAFGDRVLPSRRSHQTRIWASKRASE